MNYRLIYNCPGCGKPTNAPEGALTNRCEYCGLVVRLGAPNKILKYFYPSELEEYGVRMAADRFLKKNGLSLTESIESCKLYYVPFYRFRGMALNYIKPKIEIEAGGEGEVIRIEKRCRLIGKDFDVTLNALSSNPFGMSSLGIRPQAVPLYAFTPEEIPTETTVIEPEISPADTDRRANELSDHNTRLYNSAKIICSAMIGERISLIYFPIWALGYRSNGVPYTVFVDSLAKRGYTRIEGSFTFENHKKRDKYSSYVKTARHQCPNCGADLEEHHFSLFYPCRNCDRAYLLDEPGYKQIDVLAASEKIGLPYWRFPLEFNADRGYKTVTDFNKLLNSELALLRKEKRQNSFYLYSPGFKATDVELWVKRAIGTLLTQPHDPLTKQLPGESPELTIDESEARQMAVFLWRSATVKYPRLSKDDFRIEESSLPPGELVWLPMDDFSLIARSAEFKEVDVARQ